MKRWLSTVCLLACAAGLFAADEKKSDVTAQAVSLNIRKPLPPKKKGPLDFAPSPMTALEVAISAPGKYVLGIDVKASKLDQFTDDKGTKLYMPRAFNSWLTDYPTIDPDGDVCTVYINGLAAPAKGATKVHLKATVVLSCGTDEKATDKKEIVTKKNTKEKVGEFTFEVIDDGTMFGGPQIAVKSDKQNLKGMEFFDAKGDAIKLPFSVSPRPFYTKEGKRQYGMVGMLPKEIKDKVTVKATYFDKTEAVSVPIDLNIGVGLD